MIKKLLTIASIMLAALFFGTSATHAQDTTQWTARYWNNVTLSGTPAVERTEEDLGGDWGFGSPSDAIDSNTFSAEWTARETFEPGVHEIIMRSDDGVRVWVGGEQIISNWDRHSLETDTAYLTVRETTSYNIRVHYFESGGVAEASINWRRVDDLDESETVSAVLDPTEGQAGSSVALTAAGFPPNIGVEVGIGRANSEYDIVDLATTNDNGILNTTLEIPEDADPGEEWVGVVVSGDDNLEAISNPFTVMAENDNITCDSPYRVTFGDTLSEIAQECNVNLQALIEANTFIVNPDIILPGERITIPDTDDNGETAPTFDSVSFYLVNPGEGTGEDAIGCDDELVRQTVDVTPTPTPLTTSLDLLLGYETDQYYNALSEAEDVTVVEIAITETGEATIDLEGEIPVGGVCDEPRVVAQLRQTALQYGTIDSVTITLNGTPIDELYSG